MKKILLTFAISGMLLSSCSMNEEPIGTLREEDAIVSVKDALAFRNGLYVNLRSVSNGGYITSPDLQADNFVGMVTNGNRGGFWSNKVGILSNSTDELAPLWSGPYGAIADCNYFMEKIEPMIADENMSEDNLIALKRYRGEAHFTRAYLYWFLADRFCNSYTVIDPTAANSGLPIVTKYNPTSDYGTYPGRSTLAETFKQIESDLDKALADLTEFEESDQVVPSELGQNAAYVSTYAVMALQARIALLKGDWATAIDRAEKVIAGPFTLCDTFTYPEIWTSDHGSELIFRPYADAAQRSSVAATGNTFNSLDAQTADYIPTANAIQLYGHDENTRLDDIRYETFFLTRDLVVDGIRVFSPIFNKFPGNPEFNSGSANDLKNLGKPFRLSEMYLIIAEAGAMGSEPVKANAALKAIREARIWDHVYTDYSGQELIDQVRLERNRELIGEGFRISDLRRWKLGFSRSDNYGLAFTGVPDALVPASISVTYTATDTKYVLPIPSHEMETNPQMVQNPGY